MTLLPSHQNDQPMKQPAIVAGCEWRSTTAGTFGRREPNFRDAVGGDSLFPSTARHGTAILHAWAEDDTPARRHLPVILCANGHLRTGQTPLQADRSARSLRNPGLAATFPFWQRALDFGCFFREVSRLNGGVHARAGHLWLCREGDPNTRM